MCIIAPVVQCNLRLEPPCKLFTVDASQHTIAVLEACIPPALGAVLHRFAVRQGKWTKLLTASGAYLRERDLLPPEEELPESGYLANSLWADLVSCLSFSVQKFRRAKISTHINLKELAAWAAAERRAAHVSPNSWVLLGSDSQVCVGCNVKGRSSSPALNGILSKNLPWLLGGDLCVSPFYLRSAANPADDPTRNVPLRAPRNDIPWVAQGLAGDVSGALAAFQSNERATLHGEGIPTIDSLREEQLRVAGRVSFSAFPDSAPAASRLSCGPPLDGPQCANYSYPKISGIG